jgi:hypothetical protein
MFAHHGPTPNAPFITPFVAHPPPRQTVMSGLSKQRPTRNETATQKKQDLPCPRIRLRFSSGDQEVPDCNIACVFAKSSHTSPGIHPASLHEDYLARNTLYETLSDHTTDLGTMPCISTRNGEIYFLHVGTTPASEPCQVTHGQYRHLWSRYQA